MRAQPSGRPEARQALSQRVKTHAKTREQPSALPKGKRGEEGESDSENRNRRRAAGPHRHLRNRVTVPRGCESQDCVGEFRDLQRGTRRKNTIQQGRPMTAHATTIIVHRRIRRDSALVASSARGRRGRGGQYVDRSRTNGDRGTQQQNCDELKERPSQTTTSP